MKKTSTSSCSRRVRLGPQRFACTAIASALLMLSHGAQARSEARWALTEIPDAGLANVGATLLTLLGLTPPAEYLPSLVAPARSPR